MRPYRAWLVFLLVLFGVLGAQERRARADEVAPALESADLRVHAASELRALLRRMPAADQRRLTGVYVAFAPDANDPFAQVACDDDGDYVVLISDAMLRLSAHVARAAASEEAGAERRVEAYAMLLARSQRPGQRLLPPPPGFYDGPVDPGAYDDRLHDTLAFVVARELVRLRAGDLVCPRPTPTKERGDDVWTAEEQRAATAVAASVYARPRPDRDLDAAKSVRDAGRDERGALALLRFFAQVEVAQVEVEKARDGAALARLTYATHHPDAGARLRELEAEMPRL